MTEKTKKTNPRKKHLSKSVSDFYKLWCAEKYSEGCKKEELLTGSQYKEFMGDFFTAMYNKMIYENAVFHMPYSLGSIYIKADKISPDRNNAMCVNFAETMRLGKVIKFLNEHTWGYFFRTYWDKTYTHFTNKACYWFRAHGRGQGSFRPTGTQKLSQHIRALSKDPTKKRFIRL